MTPLAQRMWSGLFSLHLELCSLCVELIWRIGSLLLEKGKVAAHTSCQLSKFQPPKKFLSQHFYRNSLLEACAHPLDQPLIPEAWRLCFGGRAHPCGYGARALLLTVLQDQEWKWGSPEERGWCTRGKGEMCKEPQIIAIIVYDIGSTAEQFLNCYWIQVWGIKHREIL